MKKAKKPHCSLLDLWLTFFVVTLQVKLFRTGKDKSEFNLARCYHLFLSKVSKIVEEFVGKNKDLIIANGVKSGYDLTIDEEKYDSSDSIVKVKQHKTQLAKKAQEKRKAKEEELLNDAKLKTNLNELTDYINSIYEKAASKSSKYLSNVVKRNTGIVEFKNPFDKYKFNVNDYAILINKNKGVSKDEEDS